MGHLYLNMKAVLVSLDYSQEPVDSMFLELIFCILAFLKLILRVLI